MNDINKSPLLCVKSIITIIIVLAASILTFIYPDIMMDSFKSALVMVVTFYFAHQTDKVKKIDEYVDSKIKEREVNTNERNRKVDN